MLTDTAINTAGANPLPARNAPARLPTQTIVLIALAMLAPLALYFGTAASIVAIWNSSETFAHGYIIVPISAWLVWRSRANFTLYPPEPYWPALILLTGAGLAWLAGYLGGVQFVMQYAFAAMFPIVGLAVLGRRLAFSLAFPLLFLLFAVPFGDIFIEPLIEYTADFTVWALQMTGIPVLRNGTRFEIPTGSWSVVTACSGVRYLISSVTIGCLYAYLTYRSTTRRVVFVIMSIVVPIVANWLRAYMIVMIGHTSNMELATGVDHLVYGWLFFGLVMFGMFWVGSYWRDDHLPEPVAGNATAAISTGRPIGAVVAASLALCAVWPAAALMSDRANHNSAPVVLSSVAVSLPAAPSFSGWTPKYLPPDATFNAVYQAATSPVSLTLLYYRNQTNAKALVSSSNVVVEESNDDYHVIGQTGRLETLGARVLDLRETRVQGPAGKLLVWQWNWIDGQTTASNLKGKLMQAKARLFLRGDDGAAILLAAPFTDDPDQARAALRSFVASHNGAIEAALANTRSGGAR